MSNVKTVRVGSMPGAINEFAVNVGDTIASVLSLAGLSATGKEIKVDGVTKSASDVITASTNLVLLTAQVKGNSVKTVRVGSMPGAINEFAVNVGDTIASVLTLAGLSAAGKEIKVDGVTKSASDVITASTNLVLLTAQVKGNSIKTVRVGSMPGAINEYAVNVGDTIASVLSLAGLSASGKEIKVDGVTKSSSDVITASTNLVLLTAQVKGNK
jgi:cellobiose-specific phosphotransferase system component IIB